MPDETPGGPKNSGDGLGDRIRRDVFDRIDARMDDRRSRWEAKMERRRRRWQARACRRQNPFGGLLMGLLLAGVGVLLLLQNLGIFSFEDLSDYWPVILIVFGGSRLLSAWNTGGRIFGSIVLFVGGIFLLRNLGLLHGNVWAFFWPVMLIAVGLALLVRALEGTHAWDLWTDSNPAPPRNPGAAPSPPHPPPGGDLRNTLHEEHIFSGAERRYDFQDFEGGYAVAIFGGSEIDLRKSDTKREQVVIDATAICGGIEIRVPDTWRVILRGTGIFGGFSDQTVPLLGGDARRTDLILTGSAIFGGVSVKN